MQALGSFYIFKIYLLTEVYESGELEITPAAVTVTAEDKSKVYGAGDSEFTAQVDGLQNGDEVSVITYTIDRARSGGTNNGENVGEYALTPSGTAS